MIYVVTGTDTDVGKTVVTAALTAQALERGDRVAVYKPTQTGVLPGESGDAQDIGRWLGNPKELTLAEGIRLREPMAPVDAALEQGGRSTVDNLPTLEEHVARINELAQTHETILVEGAGGLLVKLTSAGETIAELAQAVCGNLVVVTRPDLGTLNHSALTLEAASGRGFVHGALILGSFPALPTAVHERNRKNLQALAEHHGWMWAEGLPAGLGSVDTSTTGNIDLWKASRKLNYVLVERDSGR